MKISICIVDYNKAAQVLSNVQGILTQDYEGEKEILIWDNSENPENAKILQTLSEIPEVEIIISEKNIGYPKANNELAKQSTGEILCFVNPDIQWEDPSTLSILSEYLLHNDKAGIIAPRQKEPEGKDALSIRKFPSLFVQIIRRTWLRNIAPFSYWVEKDEMTNVERMQTQTVDWVQSSFLMISKDLWNQLGGFNEQYFLFMADTELCKKCWEKGKQVVYLPKTEVMSDGKRCSEGGLQDFFSSKSMQIHLKDSLKYFFG